MAYDPTSWQGTVQQGGNQYNTIKDTGLVIGGPTGQSYTNQQVKDWFTANPDQSQWARQAANLGMTTEEVAQAITKGTGGNYDTRAVTDYVNNSNGLAFKDNGQITYGDGQINDSGMKTQGYYGGGSGGGILGMGSSGGVASSGGTNPYLQGMGDTIVNQMTDNYNRNQLPAMRSGAMAAGGFGGSRQGVVEANGLRDLNLGIGQNLTNLYGQDWTNSQNRNLQEKSINNSYDLGLKSNDLGFANLDSNNQQFGANYGLNVQNQQLANQQAGVNASTQMQNTPTQYNTMFNNQQNAIGGQGGTQTSTQNNQSNPWLGALGGWQLANQYTK